ncbi:MAG: Calx-beta domain-containing protein, partial [Usitatibacteraceae bacterium]
MTTLLNCATSVAQVILRFAALGILAFPIAAYAQCVSLTAQGVAYTQNFDTLVNTAGSTTNTAMPTGWQLTETGGGARDNEQYAVDTGASTTGDTYSYGAAGSTERALGALRSGTLIPNFGACFTNNTGSTLTNLDVAYVGEQWRLGTAARTDQLNFEYSTSATSLTTGTWTGVAALNFVTPNTATTGAKDGNAAANRTALSTNISALSIANGATFWIRWVDVDATGGDDGLAVDDFSLTPFGAVTLPNLSVNSVSLSEGNAGTTSFDFTVTLSAPAGVGGVTFDIATADGSGTAPSDYTAKSLTAQTIPAGSSTYTFSVLVNGDILPESTETFTVAVTNVTGANVLAGTGTGTIVNDDAAPNLSINSVAQNEGDAGTTPFAFTVTLSAPAPVGGVTFDIATADATATAGSDYVAQSLTAQTVPAGSSTYTFTVLVNGDTVAELAESFAVNVTNIAGAIGVTTSGTGTIVNDDATPIHTVQGSSTASPLVGQLVTVEGIVTGDFQGTNQLKGFYIQEPDAKADADPATSEGVFVFTNLTPFAVAQGDLVRVTGTVTEFGTAPNTLTEIVTPTIATLSTGNPLPAVTTVTLPVATAGDLERYEGMRVQFTQTLTVSDHFDLAHFGEVTLSANGRSFNPTNVVDPNDNPASGTGNATNNAASIAAFADLNTRSRILLDDASTLTFPPAIPFADPATGSLRLGSTVSNLTGILSQSFGSHRIYATTPPAFAYAARPLTPPAVGGNLKVGAMNVLNYFNGDGLGAGFPTSRGADTLAEFNRQRAKVIA